MAEKKEGKDIPREPKIQKNLSKRLFFFTAEITPIGIAKNIAKQIEKKANTRVFGNTDKIKSNTSFSL